MEQKVVPLSRTPVLLRPIAGDVAHLIDRLAEEVGELQTAIVGRRRAAILDELVDVKFFVEQLAAKHGLTPSMLTEYAMIKGWFRDAGVKDKQRELRVASAVMNGSNSMGFLQP